MKTTISLIMLSLMIGCVHTQTRTSYSSMGTRGGYDDDVVNDQVRVARFVGNAYTGDNFSLAFSKFRAVEVCLEEKNKLTRFLYSQDMTKEKKVIQTSSNAAAFATSATSAFANGKSSMWEETFRYPSYATFFICGNNFWSIKAAIKDIDADSMKPYVKDLLGAVQIVDVPVGSPNNETLKIGDLVVKVDGVRVKDGSHLIRLVQQLGAKKSVSMLVIREGAPVTTKASFADVSAEVQAEQNEVIEQVCALPDAKKRAACNKNI